MRRSARTGLVLVMIVLLLSAGILFAGEVSITWEWESAEEGVTAFRYQLDGELEDGWTVVDASVTSFNLGPVDDSVTRVLYVQQSYDGELWSESGMLAYDPVGFGVVPSGSEQEPAMVAQPAEETEETIPEEVSETAGGTVAFVEAGQPVVPEEAAAVAESEETGVAVALSRPETVLTTPPVEKSVPADSRPAGAPGMSLEVYIGAGGKADNKVFTDFFDPEDAYDALRTRILPSIAADFVYDNWKPLRENMWLGLRAGFGYQRYEKNPGLADVHAFDLHALAKIDYPVSDTFSLDAGLGFAFMIPATDLKGDDSVEFFYGPLAQINARYNLSDAWSLGVQAETRFLFSDVFAPYELTGTVRLGVGYRFP